MLFDDSVRVLMTTFNGEGIASPCLNEDLRFHVEQAKIQPRPGLLARLVVRWLRHTAPEPALAGLPNDPHLLRDLNLDMLSQDSRPSGPAPRLPAEAQTVAFRRPAGRLALQP